MGIFDRFKKQPEVRERVAPKLRSIRSYNAADSSRLLADWISQGKSSTAEIKGQLKTLRARSRDMAINNDYAARFLQMVGDNVIGPSGIKLQVKSRDGGKLDKFANDQIEAAWSKWSKRGVCTVDGRLSFRDVQKLIAETTARDGECLIRMVRGVDAKNDFNFALQVLDADYLNDDYSTNDGSAEMGVEMDSFGRPVAYHLWSVHPGSDRAYNRAKTLRVPSADILHTYVSKRPEQVRGVPWMASAMFRLKMLGGYEEAEVVAARLAASKMGFFTTPTGEEYIGDGQDAAGNTIMEAEPGVFEQLPAGVEFQEFNPTHPTSQFRDFVKGVLKGAAAGMGVSYVGLANDLESVNYSSIRQGALDERDHWRGVQSWFIDSVMQPIFDEWLLAYLSSRLTNLPPRKYDKFNAPMWSPRGWQWVDPLKEVKANVEAVAAGFKSKSEVLAEQGRDFEETLDALASEQELEEAAGLTFTPIEEAKPDEDDENA